MNSEKTAPEPKSKNNFGLIMAIYLLGLVVGGLYVGMVAPVRTVIQAQFGIGNEAGIWIITIYALFYASFIPVIGKLADRAGRKPIFLACMAVFCVGATVCGISEWIPAANGESAAATSGMGYYVLLAGRVLQAIGACGIIPLANAEIGTSAPPEKRGFALGITAAASGLSNVLGAGVGSLIISIAGQENWAVLFFACVPFGIVAIIGGLVVLPKGQTRKDSKVDVLGSIALICFVFLLLLGIQFASDGSGISQSQGTESGSASYAVDSPAADSIGTLGLAAIFGGALVGLILLIVAERRAKDPVLSPAYFHSTPIIITLAVSFLIGGMINSMTLVPEFAEASLDMPLGSGGIYMMVIGVFSLAGPPVGGKLIDKYGPRPTLMGGLLAATFGYLLLAFLAAPKPSVLTIVIGLAVMGMGLGFCMGAPVNYMILQNVPESDSNSAISAVTLVRQVGLSIAPAIYVAFITTGEGAIGYAPMFICAAVFSLLAFVLMLGYKQ